MTDKDEIKPGGAATTDAREETEHISPPRSLHAARAEVVEPQYKAQRSAPSAKAKKKPHPEVEDSIPLRIAALSMASIIITGSMAYAHANPWMTFACLWLAFMGTWLSYIYRERRPGWVVAVPLLGAIFILGGLGIECVRQFMEHRLDVLLNLIQALAILQGLHCFDLRTRDEFSMSALIGLALLAFTSGVAKDYLFLLWIAGYIISFSMMLYFDAVSRSKEVGPSKPVGEGRPASLPKLQIKRPTKAASIALLLPVLSLPVLSLLVFYFIPRTGSVIEFVVRTFISPEFAISQSDQSRGYNPSGSTPGMPFSPGSQQGSGQGTGSGTVGKGGPGGKGSAGDPKKAVNPLSKGGAGDGQGESPQKVGQQSGAAGNYRETVEEEPESINLLDDQLPANQIVLRLITNRPGYSRRVSLDLYDGTTWKRSAPTRGVAFRKDAGNIFNVGNANALLVPSDCPTVRIKQQITIDVDRLGKFLPVYWTPQAMSGIFETITVQEDGSLKVQKSLETGKSYQAISLLPIYKVSHMRNLPERTSSHFESGLSGSMLGRKEMEKAEQALMDKYRQLPDTVPEKVRKLAVKIAGKDGNWFVKAERISGYLSKNFKFAQGKPERMSDGDFVYNFLYRTRQGNCIEFASAFVVMCRAAGIPARLVSGYLPGKLNKTTGFYEVKAKDGHCWGEIYLPNWSWVPFDASPLSSYPESEEENNWLSSLAEMGLANPFGGAFQSKPSESAGAGLGQGISGSELEKQLKELADGKKTEDAKKPDAEKTLAEHLADFRWEPILILFLLGATLYILNAVTRKSDSPKVESLPQNAKKSTLIFLEVLRDLKRYKIVRIPTDTPGDLAARIHSAFEQSRQEGNHVHKELEPLISQFMEVYHLDRFGRSDRVSELESMSAQIRVLVKSKPDK